ncbi:lactate racemase domain-containing protein [Halalkalicoccus sp. NIPERK01]|uniref:lactate racemase domain-containing protein n=1 Tax=Halalkalicoccus sp. NIPERK01 TaxID=3053469 RepID=UPI00256F3C6E|nr:lactate racemase domain-containing protein [Halalkalicoccus sp. NIPERK01]
MTLEFPDRETLRGANDVEPDDLPRFARATRERAVDSISDVEGAAREAVSDLPLDSLDPGAEVAITAGSRGIHDMPALLEAAVDELRERGFEPAVIAAMGSHGGATGEGQRETLEALGITEDRLGCAIHTSMDVDEIGRDSLDRPVYVAEDALAMDAVILANRIKPHTDFHGPVESGLCKMAVIGLGKHRGAESLHNAGLASDFSEVIRERAELIIEESPVIGGIGLIEDAADRAAHVEGVPADRILEREPELLDIAREELPTLPVDDLDVLILDEMGKDVSGTGMDTNVIGRVLFHGEDEPDSPRITRIYARSLTPASHGNGVGLGLADFVHRSVVDELDLGDTYVNIVTSGETTRARIPLVVPDDLTALVLACSTTGVADPADLRVARIENTMEPDDLLVSEPVARELASREDVSVGELEPLGFEDGKLEPLD